MKRPVYEDPEQFFALTFPHTISPAVRDVALRVAGKTTSVVRQLELTYGGETHTLITLRHLVSDPATLPDLPAVAEFRQAITRTAESVRDRMFDKGPRQGWMSAVLRVRFAVCASRGVSWPSNCR